MRLSRIAILPLMMPLCAITACPQNTQIDPARQIKWPTCSAGQGYAPATNTCITVNSGVTTTGTPTAGQYAKWAGSSVLQGVSTGTVLTDIGAVSTSTTVNGHPLSSNVVVSASDITTGTLPNAQLPAAVSVTSVNATTFTNPAEFSNGTCTTAKTINPVNGNKQNVTLTNANTCALTFTQPSSGTATITLKVIQSSVSTFNGGISGGKWPGGITPTITQTSGAIDFISCYLDGTNAYCVATQDFR